LASDDAVDGCSLRGALDRDDVTWTELECVREIRQGDRVVARACGWHYHAVDQDAAGNRYDLRLRHSHPDRVPRHGFPLGTKTPRFAAAHRCVVELDPRANCSAYPDDVRHSAAVVEEAPCGIRQEELPRSVDDIVAEDVFELGPVHDLRRNVYRSL